MNEVWRTDIREGYRTKVLQFGNCKVRVHRPILTPEEQKRREAQVIEALKRFGKET